MSDERKPPWINTFNPDVHINRDMSLIHDLKKELKEDNLFLCYMVPTQVWSVCCWIRKERGWFVEIIAFASPQHFGRPEKEAVTRWVKRQDPTVREVLREIAREELEELRKWDEENREGAEAKKWIGKRLGDEGNPEWDNPGFQVRMSPGGIAIPA